MNKEQLVSSIASRVGTTQKEANEILNATLEAVMEAVSSGEKVTLVGFGTFEGRERKERQGRNPQTGEPITIPATKVPAFSPGKQFKEKVAS
ncbi:MAG: HU family DNA-binding protein [Cyanobacteriota bacterium]